MMKQYFRLGENDEVIGIFDFEATEENPEPNPLDVVDPFVENPTPFVGWPSPTDEHKLYWTGTTHDWVNTSPVTFVQRKQAAINKCFVDVDSVTEAAVGKRAKEYLDAEVAARAYKAEGYPQGLEVLVDEYVSSYSVYAPENHEHPNKWAADIIIARADAFLVAQKAMRTQRFAKHFDMNNATSDAELAVPVAQWNGFISYLRSQLGV